MPAHKHAAMIREFSRLADEHERPWEFIQWQAEADDNWHSCREPPKWCTHNEYRLKPRTITVNGIEVPAPERVAPIFGTPYYTPSTITCELTQCVWDRSALDQIRMDAGLIHLTKEAAQAHLDAMLKPGREG